MGFSDRIFFRFICFHFRIGCVCSAVLVRGMLALAFAILCVLALGMSGSDVPSSSGDEWGMALASPSTPPVDPLRESIQAPPPGIVKFATEDAPSDDDDAWGEMMVASDDDSEGKPGDGQSGPPVAPFDPSVDSPKRRARGRPKKQSAELAKASAKAAPPCEAVAVDLALVESHRVVPGSVVLSRDAQGCFHLGAGTLARLRRRFQPGESHPLMAPLREIHSCLGPSTLLEEEASSVAASLLSAVAAPVASMRLQAAATCGSVQAFASRAQTAVATAAVCSRSARWELDEGLAVPRRGATPVLYLDYARYDETPMKVRTAGGSQMQQRPGFEASGFAGAIALAPLSSSLIKWTPAEGELARTDGSHGKILQSESSYGLLMKVGEKFVAVHSQVLVHLQNLESCTAKILLAAQVAHSSVSPACASFKLRLRASTTDRASSNMLAEKMLGEQLSASAFDNLHLGCEVHVVSRIHNRVLSLMSGTTAGVLRHSLSLQGGALMNTFRRAIRLEIRARGGVRLLHGSPPVAVQRHRDFMLRLFCARGRCVLEKRSLLLLLPNGDWRSKRIELYVPHGSQLTADAAEDMVANGLVTALAGAQYDVYPRHRWTGADLAVDQCGLLEAVHCLGSSSYARFLDLLSGTETAPPRSIERAVGGPMEALVDEDEHMGGNALDAEGRHYISILPNRPIGRHVSV